MTEEKSGNGKVTIAILGNEVEHIKGDINSIKENHLPHIYNRLNGINKWLIGVLVSIIFMLAGVIASIVLQVLN